MTMRTRSMASRFVGFLILALGVAHCGDGGNDNGAQFSVSRGTFTGLMDDGGSISLEVGSIESVAFVCDGDSIQERFDPPAHIDDDGTFAVRFSDGGRTFRVRGTFHGNDTVDGEVADERHRCDATFIAHRGGGDLPTATPTRTPVDGETPATATPTITLTEPPPTGSGPTETRTPTPTPTSTTIIVDPCPRAVEVIGTAGNAKVLDTGWTGLAHNQTVIEDGKLTFALSCPAASGSCGVCDVGGPIQNAKAGAGDIDAHRCSNDTSIACAGDGDCGAGKCVFFFGSPLPLSAGGVSTCVTNQVNGAVTGTTNLESGAFATTLNLTARVFNGIETALPCPVCNGDATVNDGVKGGTCSGGPKNGQPCDGNGRSPIPSFGTTSFDCPPNPGALITALSIALDGSSGVETRTLDAASPVCSGVPTKKCFCAAEGQVTQPNACIDDSSTPENGTNCSADSGSTNEGHCIEGPIDTHCAIETFRGCLLPADCPASGDSCISEARPCYLDNGAVGGTVNAVGKADPPDANGVANPTFAALFCVGKTNAAVNAAAGLPGLGRIELPLTTTEIF
jgi:hypothetical protein